jgi:hypothetical protein
MNGRDGDAFMNSITRINALALFAAAAAWPIIVARLTALTMSPLDRVLGAAWCGAPMHGQSAFLGHCAACWAGSALFAAIGFLFLATERKPALQ